MARCRTMTVGALNIKTHPHTPKNYVTLLRESRGVIGRVRGSDWGLIASVQEKNVNSDDYLLYGLIYKFLNIDPRGKWINLLNKEAINEDDEKQKPPVIPEHLKPNLREIPYIFIPKYHRVFFEFRYITPNSLLNLLKSIFKDEKIIKQYGQIDVHVESTAEAYERILSIPCLTKLAILFTRPNDDDLGPIEKKIAEKFAKENIRRIEQVATTTDKEGIKPDKETQAFMKLALSNGNIYAKGYGEKKRIEVSTGMHPQFESVTYSPELRSIYDVIIEAATRIMKRIKRM